VLISPGKEAQIIELYGALEPGYPLLASNVRGEFGYSIVPHYRVENIRGFGI
jgi:hypothetical protein